MSYAAVRIDCATKVSYTNIRFVTFNTLKRNAWVYQPTAITTQSSWCREFIVGVLQRTRLYRADRARLYQLVDGDICYIVLNTTSSPMAGFTPASPGLTAFLTKRLAKRAVAAVAPAGGGVAVAAYGLSKRTTPNRTQDTQGSVDLHTTAKGAASKTLSPSEISQGMLNFEWDGVDKVPHVPTNLTIPVEWRGVLHHDTLGELKVKVEAGGTGLAFSHVAGQDISKFMRTTDVPHTIQLASQANALEMIDPRVTANKGLGPYIGDHTQGPIVALATLYDTFHRNVTQPHFNALKRYGVVQYTTEPVDVPTDCYMTNGYIRIPSEQAAKSLSNKIAVDHGNGLLVTWVERANTVGYVPKKKKIYKTAPDPTTTKRHHLVCSWGVPVGKYGNNFTLNGAVERARLVRTLTTLNYESVLLVASRMREPGVRGKVVFTQIGEGVFGLPSGYGVDSWLALADIYSHLALDIIVNNYQDLKPVRDGVDKVKQSL